MVWFNYLMIRLNKILWIYDFVFALSGFGGENDVSRVKRGR